MRLFSLQTVVGTSTAVEAARRTLLHAAAHLTLTPVSIVTRVRRALRNFAAIMSSAARSPFSRRRSRVSARQPSPFFPPLDEDDELLSRGKEGRVETRPARIRRPIRVSRNGLHLAPPRRGNFRSINQEETLATRCRLLHASDAVYTRVSTEYARSIGVCYLAGVESAI